MQHNQSGFTLMELVVTIVIMTLLVGIAVPAIGTIADDAKVAKILATAEAAKSACQTYRAHTSRYATEISTRQDANNHQLSENQTKVNGWKGPYLERPLTSGDNPFGGDVMIFPTFRGGKYKPRGNGFKLTGPSSARRNGDGNFIAFSEVPRDIAQAVDDAMDQGVSGNWQSFGRVQYRSSGNGTLMIYLTSN